MNERMLQPAQLENLASRGEWKTIARDFSLKTPEQFAGLLAFARKKLGTSSGQLQYLGAMIFEGYVGRLSPQDEKLLKQVTENPENELAKYRAGFALWKHGDHSDYIKVIVEEAVQCKEVAGIARELLS